MAYCSNCGKESVAKKFCEHCGIKKGQNHNFCEWCGTSIAPQEKNCPSCQEPKKNGTIAGKIIGYFFAVIFFIAALGNIGESFVAGVCFLLFALLLSPFANGLIRKATHDNMKLRNTLKIVRIIVLIVLLIIGGANLPESEKKPVEQDGKAVAVLSEEEKKEEFENYVNAVVSYEIISDYDVKSSYTVITTIDVDGDTYTGYGKVTVTDNFGDRYTGKVVAVCVFDSNMQSFKKVSLEIGDLVKI